MPLTRAEIDIIPVYLSVLPDTNAIIDYINSGLKPGIHYAVQATEDVTRLEQVVRDIIWNSYLLNAAPAGFKRGIITGVGISPYYTPFQCDMLYNAGINPITIKAGASLIFGALYIGQDNKPHNIVEWINHTDTQGFDHALLAMINTPKRGPRVHLPPLLDDIPIMTSEQRVITHNLRYGSGAKRMSEDSALLTTKDIFRDVAVKLVSERGPIKATELVVHIVHEFFKKGLGTELDIDTIPNLLEECVKAGHIVELEYVHPESTHKISSLYFPKDTTLERWRGFIKV